MIFRLLIISLTAGTRSVNSISVNIIVVQRYKTHGQHKNDYDTGAALDQH